MSSKKYLLILAVGVALFLTACSVKGKDDLEKNKPEEESRTEEQQTNAQTQPESIPEENSTGEEPPEEAPDGYGAVRDRGFDIVFDYDGIIGLCEAACGEYAQAVRNPEDANFDAYIQNENLKTYMQYRAEHSANSYSENSIYRLLVTKVEFKDDYVYVEGLTASINEADSCFTEGKSYFLIKNIDKKLCIADWYWAGQDSPDMEYRGEFSPENNIDYWEDDEKVRNLFEQLAI